VKSVEAKLILDDQVNDKGSTDANGQPQYVDKGEGFVLPDITNGQF
jgi:hypothetical protein